MALAQYIAGQGFSNVGLGIVHSMAHSLGAVYDTPHGVANAILLPTIMEYNAPATGEKYREIARAMGVPGVDSMTRDEYVKASRSSRLMWASPLTSRALPGRKMCSSCPSRPMPMPAAPATRGIPAWRRLLPSTAA